MSPSASWPPVIAVIAVIAVVIVVALAVDPTYLREFELPAALLTAA